MKAKLKITQLKSTIGQSESFRNTLKGLGLGRPGKTVVVDNTPSFRGAVKKVMHLISFEETDNG